MTDDRSGDDVRPLFGITLQFVALVAFIILALAVAFISIILVVPGGQGPKIDSGSAARVLTVLITAAVACAVLAWLDRGNIRLLGRGLYGLLDVNRAALAAFIGSVVAAIGVSIFVALSSLFAGGPEDGVFALASIEFLLKLAAVSAIITLITLRRAEVVDEKGVITTEAGDLQFGSAAFIFSLVVIAALIIPRDDILRIWSYMFGGEKKLEDYLPSQPTVKVAEDLEKRIGEAIVTVIWESDVFRDRNLEQIRRDIDVARLEDEISNVLSDSLLRQVERRGAWPLLRAVCADTEDTLLFSQSENRILAEHLNFLSTEGIVEYPYGDDREIRLSDYGREIIQQGKGFDCKNEADPFFVAQQQTEIGVESAPYVNTFSTNVAGTLFRLNLPEGEEYVATLDADNGVNDPKLELRDLEGNTISQNDDADDASLSSSLTMEGGSETILVAKLGSGAGEVTLRIDVAPPQYDNAVWLVTHLDAVTLSGDQTATIPPEGVVLSFQAPTSGNYTFDVESDAVDDVDLFAYFVGKEVKDTANVDDDAFTIIASNDDKDEGYDPSVIAPLDQGETYYLVITHLTPPGSRPIDVEVDVRGPGESPPADEPAVEEPAAEEPAVEEPAEEEITDPVVADPAETQESVEAEPVPPPPPPANSESVVVVPAP